MYGIMFKYNRLRHFNVNGETVYADARSYLCDVVDIFSVYVGHFLLLHIKTTREFRFYLSTNENSDSIY